MLLENNAVVGIGKRFFQKLSANGTVIQFNSLPIDILGTQQFAIDKALAFGLDYVYILNSDGSLDSLNPLPFEVQKTSYIDESHVLVQSTSNTYHVVDTMGTVLYNSYPSPDFASIKHIIFLNEKFWIMGENGNGVEMRNYSEVDGYGFVQVIDTLDFQPVSFELWDNHFMLIGYETRLKNQHLVVKGIVYNEAEAEINFPDVGIVELLTPVLYRYGQSFHYYVTFNVRVKNYGNEVIDSLWLNAALPSIPPFGFIGSQTCQANFYSGKFNNLNFQPNQDTILQTIQFLTMERFDLLDGKSCIWTSLPNGKRDLVSENDEACSFEYVLNASNIDILDNLNIFPNPTKDILNIQLSSTFKNPIHIQIFDLSGRLVQSENLNRGQELYQISVAHLQVGSYLLQINNGEKRIRQVFIKN